MSGRDALTSLERAVVEATPPVLFVDRALRIVYASGAARLRCAQWNGAGRPAAAGARQPLRIPPEVVRACMRLGAALDIAGRGVRLADGGERQIVRSAVAGLAATIEVCPAVEGEPVSAGFLVHFLPGASQGLAVLSPSEEQVARLVAAGASNRAVARQLNKSDRTVECQLSAIYRKLGVVNRVQLCRVLLLSVDGLP